MIIILLSGKKNPFSPLMVRKKLPWRETCKSVTQCFVQKLVCQKSFITWRQILLGLHYISKRSAVSKKVRRERMWLFYMKGRSSNNRELLNQPGMLWARGQKVTKVTTSSALSYIQRTGFSASRSPWQGDIWPLKHFDLSIFKIFWIIFIHGCLKESQEVMRRAEWYCSFIFCYYC